MMVSLAVVGATVVGGVVLLELASYGLKSWRHIIAELVTMKCCDERVLTTAPFARSASFQIPLNPNMDQIAKSGPAKGTLEPF